MLLIVFGVSYWIFELQNFVLFWVFPPLNLITLILFIEAKHNNTKTKNTYDRACTISFTHSHNFLPSFYIKFINFSFLLISWTFPLICKLRSFSSILIWRTSLVIHPLKEATFGTNLIIKFRTINFAISSQLIIQIIFEEIFNANLKNKKNKYVYVANHSQKSYKAWEKSFDLIIIWLQWD